MNLSQKLRSVSLDKRQWQKLYYKNQQEYIRKRLSAIRYLSEGKSRAEVGKILKCRDATLAEWIEKYLAGGLAELVKPISHQVKTRLSAEQQQEIKKMLLTQRPSSYGIDREIWTGKIMAKIIFEQWGVELKTSRIYEILAELNLSYQKEHRDYENASPEKQKEFVETLKKTARQKEWRENRVF